jgi:NADH-quinone oxidoreductase subunit N
MNPFNYALLLKLFAPDIAVVVALFAALLVDYGFLRDADAERRQKAACRMVSLGFLAGLFTVFWQMTHLPPGAYGEGQILLSPLTLGFKALLFVLALAALAFATLENVTVHISEFFVLLGLATLGMGFLVTTANLLSIFVALELTSLSLYALAGLRQNSRAGAEAALKYFLVGGLSSAFLLFGLSYFYGLAQALDLATALQRLSTQTLDAPLLAVAVVFLLAGLGFKIAAVPFHLWAPDIYQAAPTSAAAWIATGSKIAAFVLAVRLLGPMLLWPHFQKTLLLLLAIVSALSMIVGNLAALRQTSLKRLLAYSAIAHAGYMLIGFIAASPAGITAVLYYVVVYALANLGAFGVLLVWSRTLGLDPRLDDLAGLSRATPGLSFLFLVFILSLAGIPPLSGFLGKYYLFAAAIQTQPSVLSNCHGYYWLIGVALATSVVALYYYLKILKAVFVVRATRAVFVYEFVSPSVLMILFVLAVFILALGIFPSALTQVISLPAR